jgi:hypothetical protein
MPTPSFDNDTDPAVDPRGTAYPVRVPTARMGADARGTAWRQAGDESRSTNELRTWLLSREPAKAWTLTKPVPKWPRGTTVHACHGSYRRPPNTLTLMKEKTGRLFHPSGHQLTYPGA